MKNMEIFMIKWQRNNIHCEMNIGIAAMLAGFGFSSLKMQFPEDTSIIVEIIYLAITASAVGLELCAILNAACCSVFGKSLWQPCFN